MFAIFNDDKNFLVNILKLSYKELENHAKLPEESSLDGSELRRLYLILSLPTQIITKLQQLNGDDKPGTNGCCSFNKTKVHSGIVDHKA